MPRKAISSTDLGIDLATCRETELFKWLLACLLFGKPIQQQVAQRTYLEFVREGLTTPDAILNAGWEKLVEDLDRGHYVRYDFSTPTKLLDTCRTLQKRFGTVTRLLAGCESRSEVSKRLQEFKGVGPVTAWIFVRELGRFKN